MTRVENTMETGLADQTILTAANSDDGTAGTALSTTGAGGTIGTDNTIYYSTTSPIRGSLSLLYDLKTADSTSTTATLSLGAAATTVSCRVYLKPLAFPGTGTADISRLLTAGNARTVGLRLSSAGVLSLVNSSGTTLSTGPTLTIGSVYRIEIWVTPGATTSTGRVGWTVYAGHSTTTLHTYSATNINAATAGANRQELGKTGTPNTDYSFLIDDWVVDDGIGETFIGPAVVQAEGAVQFDATSAVSVAALGQYLGAVQANATSAVSVAPLAQRQGAVTIPGTSTTSFAPTSSASVRADAVSVVSFAPVLNGPSAFTVTATSAVSFAPLAQKRAAVTTAATSAVSFSPLAQLRAAFAASATSTVTLAALAQPRAAFTTAAGSTVSFAPTTPPKSARVYYRGSLIERAYYQGEEVAIR